MPALKNPVYEAFSQETFRRLTTGDGAPFQGRVYSAIGFTKNANSARVQASRMMKAAPEIGVRIRELLDEAAKASKNTVQSIGAATLSLDQQIRRESETLVVLDLLVACIGPDGRPRRLPPGLRAALACQGHLPVSSPPIVQKTP